MRFTSFALPNANLVLPGKELRVLNTSGYLSNREDTTLIYTSFHVEGVAISLPKKVTLLGFVNAIDSSSLKSTINEPFLVFIESTTVLEDPGLDSTVCADGSERREQ